MRFYKTDLKYAGRDVIRNNLNQLYYVASRHRTYKAYKDKDMKRGNPANLARIGAMYLAVYRLPSYAETKGQRTLGIRR